MPSAIERERAGRTHAQRARDRAADEGFNADERGAKREATPATIGGVRFSRRRKDWRVSRLMRQTMRAQEKAVAFSNRAHGRVAELEVAQAEAARDGDTAEEAKLEERIDELVDKADEATEEAETVTYRLLALLLVPPAEVDDDVELPADGFGPDAVADSREADVQDAVEWLQPRLDVEDAADLARDLTGSREPDPQPTPSSETGST
jgi:seryl-tRNA synthetase